MDLLFPWETIFFTKNPISQQPSKLSTWDQFSQTEEVVVDLVRSLGSLLHLIKHFLYFQTIFYKKANISATKQAINMGPFLPYSGGGGGLADLSQWVTMLLKNFKFFAKFASFSLVQVHMYSSTQ